MREVYTTAPVSERVRRELDQLEHKDFNFDVGRQHEFTRANGWDVDDYCQELPPETPGPPLEAGSWEACRRLMATYEFADPSILRAAYRPDTPLEGRNLLAEGRFYGLRFLLGLRIGGVVDTTSKIDDREVRRWGWNYRTLQGHLEMGQMDYEVWKWQDSGQVEFRIHAFSKPADIPNPIVRLGFALFGRVMQRRFARRALQRMDRLVRSELVAQATGVPLDEEIADIRKVSVRPANDKRDPQRVEEGN